MQKGETPADVWWVPRTGASLRFGFTVMGRTVDGCARKCMGTLCHQQIRHQLGERIQRGAMARWQEVLAELALGKRRNVGMAEAAWPPHSQPNTITTKKRQFEFLKKGHYSTQQTFHTFDLQKCQMVSYYGTKRPCLRLSIPCQCIVRVYGSQNN